jgi:hypothetical protein
MELVNEIRDDILKEDVSLSVALRKAKVLASMLKDEEFKEWVNHELNGYPTGSETPEYRVLPVQITGTFSGPFGSGAKGVSVPIWKMGEEFQDRFGKAVLNQGVKELESMTEGESDSLHHQWPGEAVAYWNMEYEAEMNLVGASSHFSSSSVEGVLDTIKNRLLDFILKLTDINPEIKESEEAISELPKDKVRNVFNYTIYGDHNVVAAGEDVNQDVKQVVPENDTEELISYFQSLGVSADDTNKLVEAIERDDEPDKGDFGENVQSWIGRMITKASQGVWEVGLNAAPKLITKGLASYYGWDVPPQ